MSKLVTIDDKDKTAYCKQAGWSGVMYFFRSVFEDGCILAWFSHSPWGRCEDMEKGWVVINPKTKEIVDECETRMSGVATGDYRDWIKDVRNIHGKTTKVFRYEDGKMLWTMQD